MAKKDIKIPAVFFDTKEWLKKRVYSEAEALLDMMVFQPQLSFFALANRWGWHRQKVKRFLEDCDGFVTLDVTRITLKNNALQGKCDGRCDGFVTDSKETEENKEKRSKKENKEEKEIYNPLLSKESIPLTPFDKFKIWLSENAPRVLKMKEPFTEAQFLKAREAVGGEEMRQLLTAMHNYEPLLKKNISAYLTLMNWWKRDRKEESSTNNRPYKIMTYEEMLAVMDKERIPMTSFTTLYVGSATKPMWVRITDKTKYNIPDKIAS